MNSNGLSMRKSLSTLTTFLLFFITISSAQALTIDYSVSGKDLNGNDISGFIDIDSQVKLSNVNTGNYEYSIVNFNLYTNQYDFFGTSGSLSLVPGRNPGEVVPGDSIWSLNGSGDAQQWFSGWGVVFENADGTAVGNYDYMSLAPEIYLVWLPGMPGSDLFQPNGDGITLTQTAAPVPEPGTILLIGFGMLGLPIYGKRRTKVI